MGPTTTPSSSLSIHAPDPPGHKSHDIRPIKTIPRRVINRRGTLKGGHDSFPKSVQFLFKPGTQIADRPHDSALASRPPAPNMRTMRLLPTAAFATLLLPLLPGCQAPAAPDAPTEMSLHISDYDAFIDNSLTLLREFDFVPQRVDRTAGEIVTLPTTSGQWFEFWRGDVIGAYQSLESSLHTVRRSVAINLARDAEGPEGDYRVAVTVAKTRYSAPDRQVTTPSGALAIYSDRLPTTEGLKKSATRGEHWVELGRDGLLEARLLARLRRLAAEPITTQPTSVE